MILSDATDDNLGCESDAEEGRGDEGQSKGCCEKGKVMTGDDIDSVRLSEIVVNNLFCL